MCSVHFEMSSNDKIEVESLDQGRSLGSRLWIRGTNVMKGDIIVGQTITIMWEKLKNSMPVK